MSPSFFSLKPLRIPVSTISCSPPLEISQCYSTACQKQGAKQSVSLSLFKSYPPKTLSQTSAILSTDWTVHWHSKTMAPHIRVKTKRSAEDINTTPQLCWQSDLHAGVIMAMQCLEFPFPCW